MTRRCDSCERPTSHEHECGGVHVTSAGRRIPCGAVRGLCATCAEAGAVVDCGEHDYQREADQFAAFSAYPEGGES